MGRRCAGGMPWPPPPPPALPGLTAVQPWKYRAPLRPPAAAWSTTMVLSALVSTVSMMGSRWSVGCERQEMGRAFIQGLLEAGAARHHDASVQPASPPLPPHPRRSMPLSNSTSAHRHRVLLDEGGLGQRLLGVRGVGVDPVADPRHVDRGVVALLRARPTASGAVGRWRGAGRCRLGCTRGVCICAPTATQPPPCQQRPVSCTGTHPLVGIGIEFCKIDEGSGASGHPVGAIGCSLGEGVGGKACGEQRARRRVACDSWGGGQHIRRPCRRHCTAATRCRCAAPGPAV